MEVNESDMRGMLISSVRYALGRRTYIVSETCEWVKRYGPLLETPYRDIMIRDIEEQERWGYGDSCDLERWMDLLEWLRSTEG